MGALKRKKIVDFPGQKGEGPDWALLCYGRKGGKKKKENGDEQTTD